MFVSTRKGGERDETIWDERCPHLALVVRTSGTGAGRWSTGTAAAPLATTSATRATSDWPMPEAGARIMLDVAEGKDPVAERKAERTSGPSRSWPAQYVELHAKKHNKSWKQAERARRQAPPAAGGAS